MSKKKQPQTSNKISEQPFATKIEVSAKPTPEILSFKNAFYILAILLVIGCFWVFKDFLSGKNMYLFKDIGSDTLNQIYAYAKLMIDTIEKDGIPRWSFQQGLGQYVAPFNLGNPFHWIVYLMGINNLPYSIGLIEFVKFISAGLVFYAYLRQLSLSAFACVIGGLVYGLSSFLSVGSGWFNFFTGWAVEFAFWQYALESLLRKDKWYFMPLAVAFVAIDQPFNLFLIGEFSIIYVVAWYFFNKQVGLKNYLVSLAKLIGTGVLGLLIGAVMFGANLYTMINSPRVAGGSSYFSTLLTRSPILQPIDALQAGTIVTRFFGNNLIGVGNAYRGWSNYMEAPNFYLGLFSLLLFPQLFFFLDKKYRKVAFTVTGIILLIILFPFFRHAFWGFTGDYYRLPSLFIGVTMLIATLFVIGEIEKGKKLNLYILGGTYVFWLSLLLISYTTDWDSFVVKSEKVKVLLLFTILFVLFVIYNFWNNSLIKYFILGITFFEVIGVAYTTLNKRDIISASEWKEKSGFNDYSSDAVKVLNDQDKTFYRIEKDYSSGTAIHSSTNDPMVQGYNGTTVYTAFNHKSQVAFMAELGIINPKNEFETRWLTGLKNRPLLLGHLGVKYVLSKNVIPFKNFGYDSLTKVGDVTIFKNPNALPMGFTYDEFMTDSNFKNLSALQKDLGLLNAFVIPDADKSKFEKLKETKDSVSVLTIEELKKLSDERKKEVLQISSFSNNEFKGELTLSSPKLLYLSIPFDDGWKIESDGIFQKPIKVNYGMTGVLLDKGKHSIIINYEPPFLKVEIWATILGCLIYLSLLIWTLRNKKEEVAPVMNHNIEN